MTQPPKSAALQALEFMQNEEATYTTSIYGGHPDGCDDYDSEITVDLKTLMGEKVYNHILNLLSQASSPQGWQPIESAPRDGTEIMGGWAYPFHDYSGTPIAWQRGDGREGWFMLCPTGEQPDGKWYPCPWLRENYEQPTHWRPRISPPHNALTKTGGDDLTNEQYKKLSQDIFNWTQDCGGIPLQDDINQLIRIVQQAASHPPDKAQQDTVQKGDEHGEG